MLKDLSPKKRFGLMLVAVCIVSLPVIFTLTCVTLKQNAVRAAYDMLRLRLTAMEAAKTYVAGELGPIGYQEQPEKTSSHISSQPEQNE